MGVLFSAPAPAPFDYDKQLLSDTKPQSRLVDPEPNDPIQGGGRIIRSLDIGEKDPVIDSLFPDGKTDEEKRLTVWSAWTLGLSISAKNKCLGTRVVKEDGSRGAFVWDSYEAVDTKVHLVARGLASLGVQKGDTVGICSANTAEWIMVALANYCRGAVNVALYDTLGAEAVEYITNHAEVKIVCCSKVKLPLILSVLPKCPNVKTVIQWDYRPEIGNKQDAVSEADRKTASGHGATLYGFSELVKMGEQFESKLEHPNPGDLQVLMYTSGTTGVPKGVMLTNRNIMSCYAGFVGNTEFHVEPNDVWFSYLPLAHIFETVGQICIFTFGGAIAVYSGSPKTLLDDIQTAKPAVMPGVPRVFSRIYDKVMAGVQTKKAVARNLFMNALAEQSKRLREGRPLSTFYDKLVFAKLRKRLGMECVKTIVYGAAPMPPYLAEFLRVVFNPSMGVTNGYGMTETAAAVCSSKPFDLNNGHVGCPLLSAEVRLQAVEEMGYSPNNNPPTGEILARGPSITIGYYKDPKTTAETIEHGWIHTGDVGRLNPNGTISIIDRKKNIFKLAQGEYVAAEKLEDVFQRSSFINQMWVYGNSYKTFLLGVVVPDVNNLLGWMRKEGMWPADGPSIGSEGFLSTFHDAVEKNLAAVKKVLLDEIQTEAKKAGLLGYEVPKDIFVESRLDPELNGFNVENDCVTPTFKKRRTFLLQRYKDVLMKLYTDNGEPPSADEKW